MITFKAMDKVASGGICNSGAAVDLAKISMTATAVCQRSYVVMTELGGMHADRSFTANEVRSLIGNLINPLDVIIANVVDNGMGESLAAEYERKKQEAAAGGEVGPVADQG